MVARKRGDLHELIDELPESEVPAARRSLRFLREVGSDPVHHAAETAPADDEPMTEEDEAALRKAREEAARGEVISLGDLRRELGL